MLINNFDIFSDFYSDSQIKAIFREEYEAKVPSHHMWALILYAHPDSKYSGQKDADKKALIEKDYLGPFKDPIKWEDRAKTLEKIISFLLTKPKRLLKGWEIKLEERDTFIASIPYNAETYELLDKMMGNTAKI